MSKSLLLGIPLVLTLIFFAVAVPVSADSPEGPKFVDLLVRFRPELSRAQVNHALSTRGLTQVEFNSDLDLRRARAKPGTNLGHAIVSLQADPQVLLVEPNYIVKAQGYRQTRFAAPLSMRGPSSKDPFFGFQWGLQKVQAPLAWSFARGTTVTVAIIDSGIDLAHPDLRNRIVKGFNFVNPGTLPQDDFWHGTHVSGIAAAIQDNRTGIAGTAVNLNLKPLKILDAAGEGSLEDLESAIHYAARQHVRVINMSLGTLSDDHRCPVLLQEQINFAHDRGVTLVAAAGNQSGNEPFFPAGCRNVIGVTSTGPDDLPSWFDNNGEWIDIAAPGEDILSTIPGGYDYAFGTSMSTAFVSGAAAMVWSRNATLTPDDIERILERSADRFGWVGRNNIFGWGRLNAANSLGGSR